MKIGIIGAGKIGGTLTRRLRSAGHDVTVANSRGPETLAALAGETGAAADTPAGAAAGADVVVVAVPVKAVPELPADALAGKIVIDANNYYAGRDGDIPAITSGGAASSRWLADQLPGARVVKAFNSMYFVHLNDYGRPIGDPARLALPLAGDDAEAKRVVAALIDELGFDPVDAGGLDDSWRQQPDTPVYAADLNADAVRAGLAAARR